MKIPLMVSRTRVWAPKPSATPAMPALAISGPMLTPVHVRIDTRTTNQTITMAVVAARLTMVTWRRSLRALGSSPASLACRRA